MPLIQAFQCPRTQEIFSDKDEYLAHLKALALTSLRSDNAHPRLKIIKSKFDDMRQTVTTYSHISKWLAKHVKILTDLAVYQNQLSPKEAVLKPVILDVKFDYVGHQWHCSNQTISPKNGVKNYLRDNDKPFSYPGKTGDIKISANAGIGLDLTLADFAYIFIKKSEAVFNKSNGVITYDSSFTMFAEDWPFIGADYLYAHRHNNLTDEHLRILSYAFPGITIDDYVNFNGAGLFPEDKGEFCQFMMQYTKPKLTPSAPSFLTSAITPELPDDVTLGS